MKKSDGIARNVTIIDETTKAMDDVDINASMRLTKSSMGAHGRQQSRERSSSIKRERTNKNRSQTGKNRKTRSKAIEANEKEKSVSPKTRKEKKDQKKGSLSPSKGEQKGERQSYLRNMNRFMRVKKRQNQLKRNSITNESGTYDSADEQTRESNLNKYDTFKNRYQPFGDKKLR